MKLPEAKLTSTAPSPADAWARRRWALPAILALALLLRLLVSTQLYPAIQGQTGLSKGSDGYEHIGRTLATGHGFRFAPDLCETMFLPPAYPLFLAGIFWLTGEDPAAQLLATQVVQSLLDTLSCLIVYLLARRWTGELGGLLAALIYALYPGSWIAVSRYLTEPLFVLLALLFVHAFARYLERPGGLALLGAGVGVALAVLCKSVAGLLPPFLLGCALLLPGWGRLRWRAVGGLAACGLIVALAVTPWIARNYRLTGQFVYPTTSGGLALYTAYIYAANPQQEIRKSAHQAAFEVRALAEQQGLRLDPRDKYPRWFYDAREELRADQLAQAAAREWLSGNRAAVAQQVLGNAWRFWIGAPTPKAMLAAAAIHVPLLLLAVVGLTRLRFWRCPSLYVWVCTSLYLVATHVAVLSVVRYALTVMPLVCALAAVGLLHLLRRSAGATMPHSAALPTVSSHPARAL